MLNSNLANKSGLPEPKAGNIYPVKMKDLNKDLLFFLYDDYNFPIGNEIKQGIKEIIIEPIRLINCVGKKHGNKGAFIDIGANIGQFSLVAAAYGYKVFGFEGNATNVQQLRQSASANGFDAEFIEKIVVDKPGAYHFSGYGPWGNIFELDTLGFEDVEMPANEGIAIDDWYQDAGAPPIEFVKMDIEGAEFLAFEGMRHMLKNNEFPPLYVEYNCALAPYHKRTFKDFMDFFKLYGYEPYLIKKPDALYKVQPNDIYNSINPRDYLLVHENSPLLLEKLIIPFPVRDKLDFLDDAYRHSDVRLLFGFAYIVNNTPELLLEKKLVSKLIAAIKTKSKDSYPNEKEKMHELIHELEAKISK